jgi:hypothetical protein
MGKLFTLPLFFYSVRLIRAGKLHKKGEKAILDEILSLANEKILRGIINLHPTFTDHVDPRLRGWFAKITALHIELNLIIGTS